MESSFNWGSTDYELQTNNCTTICVAAIKEVTGLEEVSKALEGQYDPRELYELLESISKKAPGAELTTTQE